MPSSEPTGRCFRASQDTSYSSAFLQEFAHAFLTTATCTVHQWLNWHRGEDESNSKVSAVWLCVWCLMVTKAGFSTGQEEKSISHLQLQALASSHSLAIHKVTSIRRRSVTTQQFRHLHIKDLLTVPLLNTVTRLDYKLFYPNTLCFGYF